MFLCRIDINPGPIAEPLYSPYNALRPAHLARVDDMVDVATARLAA